MDICSICLEFTSYLQGYLWSHSLGTKLQGLILCLLVPEAAISPLELIYWYNSCLGPSKWPIQVSPAMSVWPAPDSTAYIIPSFRLSYAPNLLSFATPTDSTQTVKMYLGSETVSSYWPLFFAAGPLGAIPTAPTDTGVHCHPKKMITASRVPEVLQDPWRNHPDPRMIWDLGHG